MFDTNDVAQRPRGAVEIRSGVVRRRRWPALEKGRIVAQAIAPGAVISQVARRHEMTPQHLSNWIRAAKAGRLALPGDEGMAFVPVIAGEERCDAGERAGAIEIVIGCMTVRLAADADPRRLEDVLRAARRSLS